MINSAESLVQFLLSQRDENYAAFNSRLIPNIDPQRIIGVRAPLLRKTAASLSPDFKAYFLSALPHFYHEENILHAYLISRMREPEKIIEEMDKFLPYVDNWAVCDSIRPSALKKQHELLYDAILRWLSSSHSYTVRFALGMLMSYFLDENFDESHLELAAGVESDEYYVNMMISWYFATALAKQWDSAVLYLEGRRLSPWVHNKTIQKAIESYRVSDWQKARLRTLKVDMK